MEEDRNGGEVVIALVLALLALIIICTIVEFCNG